MRKEIGVCVYIYIILVSYFLSWNCVKYILYVICEHNFKGTLGFIKVMYYGYLG